MRELTCAPTHTPHAPTPAAPCLSPSPARRTVYEGLKKLWGWQQGRETSPAQGAACGSFSGAVAGAATCPFDVVKTRMMLGHKTKEGLPYVGTLNSMKTIYAQEGWRALFHGLGPRVGWITIGGYVFFGAYEQVCVIATSLSHTPAPRPRPSLPSRYQAQQLLWKTGSWGEKPTKRFQV